MTAGLQAHQSNLIKQMNPFNSIAEYNLNKLIRDCKNAINSAATPQEAQAIASFLETALAEKGKGLNDVQGLNFDKLTNANPLTQQNNPLTPIANGGKTGLEGLQGDAKKAAKKARKDQYKPLFTDLKAEFNVTDSKDKSWIEAAKKSDQMRIIDKNGQDITQTYNGEKLKGVTLEINSKKHGKIQIQAGGDGYLNGGDDKITMVGGPAAAGNMTNGLNQINNFTPGLLPNGAANQNPLLQGLNPQNPQAAADVNAAMGNGLLTASQIKNLIAAILDQALFSIDQNKAQQASY